ncbi:pancreatic lipase-related protein 2-like [Oppia nitens]|uniref:pancreatic lipase-related protein 2-like n=1 Tax=Oppia nitens TaxID=1686743 RepID=UPI0023DC31AB|nr:pancreatic lipase-related protein 2-like [Oppia nitens]
MKMLLMSPKIIITILSSLTLINNSMQVCYDNIGCFSKDGPMKQTGLLPASPNYINTKFYAYTSQTPQVGLEVDPYSLDSLNVINVDKPIVFVIHGYGNSGRSKELVQLKDSLQFFGQIETVVMVDWEKGAELITYDKAATNTQVVGRQVAYFVETLRKSRGLDPQTVHLIGFSLGAHVSGYAAKYSKSQYNWTFGRISGLDPAQPKFEGYPGSHLTKDDAIFVDVIHTSSGHFEAVGELGFIGPIGDIDFYPNNGKHQPRCALQLDPTCNHYSSIFYYEASLSGVDQCQCTAYKCNNWDELIKNKCNKKDASRMGFYSITKPGRGVYYLQVSQNYPFCKN